MNRLLIYLFLAFAVSGTIFGQMPKIETGVSKELAKWRTENYSDVKFGITLTLEKLPPKLTKLEKLSQTLKGAVEISLFNKGDLIVFDWRKLKGKEDLSKISNLSVNGRPAYFEEVSGHLILKEGVLKNKSNTIRFEFTTPIEIGGAVTRYIDESDNSEFLYSVPNAGNDIFPTFNQTDLKAQFQFTATKADSWKAEILTNSNGTYVQSFRLGETIYSFAETAPISPNIFAFAAGDFALFDGRGDGLSSPATSNNANANGQRQAQPLQNSDVPTKIYVRKSQAEKFKQIAAVFFLLILKKDKFAKLDIVLLPEISNIQTDYEGLKFIREDSIYK